MFTSVGSKLLPLVLANTLLFLTQSPLAGSTICPSYGDLKDELGMKLSPSSSVTNTLTDAPRWSLYDAPVPAWIINVASERDVATTVRHELYILQGRS